MSESHSESRARLYKQAFTAVMGDPFAPEDITDETTTGPDAGVVEGASIKEDKLQRIVMDYPALKACSPLQAQRYNFGDGRATNNPMRPSIVDFLCDVERVIAKVFNNRFPPGYYQAFMDLYVFSDIKLSPFRDKERSDLELQIGRLFLYNGMSPTAKYFQTTRRPSPEKDRQAKEQSKCQN